MVSILVLVLGTGVASAAQLELVTIDGSTERQIPARIRLRCADGQDIVPPGAVEVPVRDDRWFVTSGTVRLELPVGEIEIRVERGKEYIPVKERLTLGADGLTRHQISVRRWIDMQARGYLSGENHIHIAPTDLPAVLAAEDLNYGSSLYWWNGPKIPLSEGPEPVRTMSFGGITIPASVFDAEVEGDWGPAYLIGLQEPLPPDVDPSRPNLFYLIEGRRQGALLCYNSGWAVESLFDALAGYVEVVDVCNNLFYRHRFAPRKGYSNLLGVEGLTVHEETPRGMFQMNLDAYYRLLNCGLQIAAGADSAVGAKATPAGYNRAYVRRPAGASLGEFLDGWRQGRNFVTNGPMLFLTAGDAAPGDTLSAPGEGQTIEFRVQAISNEPLESLELIANGRVVATAQQGIGGREATLVHKLSVRESTWVAARCADREMLLSEEELERYRRPPGKPREEPCRLRFAHTSPIYATVAGSPVHVASSIEEARRILDAFERFAEKKCGDRYRQELRQHLEAARSRLR